MRILVIGAGAMGGYFGARLLAAGRDVTFLVRPKRAVALAKSGLVVKSKAGDLHLPSPPTVTSEQLNGPYDLIIVSCKAYDLDGAIESFAPAVHEKTVIIPLLNGLRHLDVLNARFGKKGVFGGQCAISAALSAEGEIVHLSDLNTLSFGEQNGARSERRDEIVSLSGANFVAELSENILLGMWEKWVFIATIAGSTCLMRASTGDVVAAGASSVLTKLLGECSAIAARHATTSSTQRRRREARMPPATSTRAPGTAGARNRADTIRDRISTGFAAGSAGGGGDAHQHERAQAIGVEPDVDLAFAPADHEHPGGRRIAVEPGLVRSV